MSHLYSFETNRYSRFLINTSYFTILWRQRSFSGSTLLELKHLYILSIEKAPTENIVYFFIHMFAIFCSQLMVHGYLHSRFGEIAQRNL